MSSGDQVDPLAEFDTSFFPAPSPYFARYTSHNLTLPPTTLISDVPGEPQPFYAQELQPPDIDDIVKDGSYSVFGETWPVQEQLPTLEEMGVKQLYQSDQDRKIALQTLLRTIILTYTQLLTSLVTPPPSRLHPQPPANDPERFAEHVRLVSINMHHLVNELRPVQARETLKSMMRFQIDERKRKTALIKSRCQEIREKLAKLHEGIVSTTSSIAQDLDTNGPAIEPIQEIDRKDEGTKQISTIDDENEDSSIRNRLARMVQDY